ncbi:LysE family translocator [Hoeflea sp. YIM 152468]|uniref:LysE family translocator n=1 Tax=Hoeflea sp. YIM 152468 TaxID=3031759 RepID=UPI0023DADCDC|nr:LysE family translocator [Hoeflea sp. YIM 152468]MDF1608207.1 LysE family translocator [Hoeflea sp. YIM 152468]
MDYIPGLPVLAAFALATLLLAITPGPDMTLWMSRTIRDGRTIGLMTLLGTNLGIGIHTLLVAFGVSALIVASPVAFLVLKTGGAGYLLWLAIQAVRNRSVLAVKTSGKTNVSMGKAFLNGLWVNLLNPKVIIFFMTFLPQFVSVNDPQVTGKLIFLGVLSILIALPIAIVVVLGANGLADWLKRKPQVMRIVDYVFAAVFSVFAVKILLTQNR